MSAFEEYSYEHAAVAADSQESSQIGTSIMRDQGGSAVDAAIASVLCSGVVNAHSCGIGGGTVLTYYNRSTGKVYTINGRGQAPSGIRVEMCMDDTLSLRFGGLSVCIPGEILCLYEAWKLGGRLPWEDLFQPTIDLCRNGFKVRKVMADAIKAVIRDDSEEIKKRVPNFMEFLNNPETGNVYKEGDTMYRPRLAKTLEVIANQGPDAFYNGSLTEDIIADIKEANGLLTTDDFRNYIAAVKPPISLNLNDGSTVYSPPLPSCGIVYQFILNILKGFNFDKTSVSTTDQAIITWHRITEAFKHGSSFRYALGDIDVSSQDFKRAMEEIVRKATDENYGESMRLKIDDTRTFDLEYYEPINIDDKTKCHGTSHLSVFGPEGDAVAVTSTVSMLYRFEIPPFNKPLLFHTMAELIVFEKGCQSFGSKIVGTRTGIVFNDEMRNFSIPNSKHRYGRPPSFANIVEPFKRPLTSMCPSIIVDKDGDVKLVVGGSGSSRIPTAIALVTIETLWFKWSLKEAIDSPRIHHQLYPPELSIQSGFPQELVDGLKRLGHEVIDINCFSVVQGILKIGNKITAYSDKRKEGRPDGY